ncbi:MAG TPA: phage tail tip lysozyme, partial [Hyphomicrobiaceae bacterium]|nr:phage tail tip lysozyme [Hyphomicrobiaceae bacterium]
QARGWSPNTTRGMIGNFNVESRLNPLAAGDLNNPKGLAAGLGQHRLDRLAALQAETRPFEGLNRKTKTFTSGPSLDQQADFIDREMQGLSTNTNRGARKVGRTFQANPNMSVADATSTFARGYERPSKAALRSSMPQRLAGTGFDFGESTAPGLTQIAGRESTITPAGYTTAMPRAKPDLRGLTMGMPRDKPSLPAAFSGGPVLAGVPRAKPSSPALRSTMAQAFSTARPMRLGGGLSSLGTRGRQRTIL